MLDGKENTSWKRPQEPERESDMFLIATITNKAQAPRIRRQLKAQGFGYNRTRREWVKNCMTLRGARLDLPRARTIDGATIEMRTGEEMHAIINTAITGKETPNVFFTAKLTAINEDYNGEFLDTVTIYQDGEEIDTVQVESSEDSEPYDAAVKSAIDGKAFEWLPSGF